MRTRDGAHAGTALRPESRNVDREAGKRELVLVCTDLQAPPDPVLSWTDSGELRWWLARAWPVGAVVGFLGLLAKAVLFFA